MYRRSKEAQSLLDLINNPADKIKQQPKPPYRSVEAHKEENLVQKTLEEITRPSDGIPKFTYPFKRRTNTATKTKSDQEIYEEILFKDKTAQYLFNRSGLFHGGVHLKAEEFGIDFEVEKLRAIADGELVFYRIDKEYLTNTLKDELGDEYEVQYSTGFFLLEHKLEYPKGNQLKFYSLYMHTAPSYAYKFIEHIVMGQSAYARKTFDNSNADDFVKFGDKVVLGKPIANKDGRYELLSVNGIKVPNGFNVHISNLLAEMVTTTVKGSKPNMRRGNTNSQKTSPTQGLLKDKSSITVNAYQTEKQKKNKRYQVLKAIKADGTVADIKSDSTISASNLKDSIKKVDVFTPHDNGVVLPHMKEMAGSSLKPTAKGFKVKAGDTLGYLGVYNSKWWETELDKVVHLEVFTFDDIKGFIEKTRTEYAKKVNSLSDEAKKLRPKENLFIVPKDEKELFILDSVIYGETNRNTMIREGMVKTKTNQYKVANEGTELAFTSTKNSKRQKISKWEGETLDDKKTYSAHIAHIDFYKKFIALPQTAEILTQSIRMPISKIKTLKDKDDNKYICIDENLRLYVKDKKEYKTHGITFPNFKLIDEAGADKVGIFEEVSKYYAKNIEEDETPQQEKEKLNATFKSILQKIKVDENNNGNLEAGEFASLSLTKEKRKELSYMMVKHESEWEHEKEKFEPIITHLKNHNKSDHAKMFEERLEKLALFPKDLVGKGQVPTFIHPIALVEGFVGGNRFNWSKTPIIKLIISKESKGSYSAYNITGWKTNGTNKVYESHFKAEGTYLITTMTISEIKSAQSTMVGINRKHLFAIGLYQMIPKTFEAKINIKNKAGKITGTKLVGFLPWVKSKTTIDESTQLFDEKFQDMMPLYFWESKQKNIGRYFKGTKTAKDAAYSVAKEWASAGVPNGLYTKSGSKSDGNMSYYGGDGLNSAHYSGADTIKALEETKVMLDLYGGYDKVIKESFN